MFLLGLVLVFFGGFFVGGAIVEKERRDFIRDVYAPTRKLLDEMVK
jgi:hypothetical protein